MEPNKILSATLIDVIFDGRNKEYGAYELRKNDSKRTKVALSATIAIVALVLTGTTLANSFKKEVVRNNAPPGIILTEFVEVKPPEEIPEPQTKQQDQIKTEKFTQIVIVDKDDIDPPPSIADLDSAGIDVVTREGKPDVFIADPPQGPAGDGKGIIEPKVEREPEEPRTTVDVPAKFEGNWVRFLEKNLNAETPVINDAPPGRYSVVVQFVVDKEGNVSDIKALTNHGYGVEEESVRVLKKAPKWQPAMAAGFTVKAYHKQVIIFEVTGE
jgi:periplasmic protein TonB